MASSEVSPRTSPLLLRGGALADGTPADLLVRSGRIAAVLAPGAPVPPEHDRATPDDLRCVDVSGHLLVPAPVEPHAHLDKALTAGLVDMPGFDLVGAVAAWRRISRTLTEADIVARASEALDTYVSHGATAMRSHVDVGGDAGLRNLAALAAVRDANRDRCDLRLVAFAAMPLTGPGAANAEALMRDALAAGADALGACPALDPDPAGCVDACVRIAGAGGAALDLHIDETLDIGLSTLEHLARAITADRFDGGVVASHCVNLSMMDDDRFAMIAAATAEADISVVCLPQTNLYLQGRDRPVATPRGLTPVRRLRAAGVRVCAGGDNLRDPFNPMGRADPLETAALLVLVGHDTPTSAYDSISTAARAALRLPAVSITAGAPAEILAIRARSVGEAIATAHPDRLVIHEGRVVSHTTTRVDTSPRARHRTHLAAAGGDREENI